MKIGILGDTHFNNRAPERRIDDYWATQIHKLCHALSIFKENRCGLIIQTGDFTDNPHVSISVMRDIDTVIKSFEIQILTTFGQHDIIGHSKTTLPNSPLTVFEMSKSIHILDNHRFSDWYNIGGLQNRVSVYGAGFGEDIPIVINKEDYNILVTHRMIGDRQLYPEQELAEPRQFLRDYPDFNLICVGDYHYRYIDSYQGRTILNPGALMRKTISKFDVEHRPAVIIFDTSTNKAKVIELDFRPAEEVFDFSDKVKTTDYSALNKFIDAVKNRGTDFTGWRSVLLEVLKEKEASEEIGKLIDDCLEEIKNAR